MQQSAQYKGNDTLLFGIILGVLSFWLFAQTILNINVDMAGDLKMRTSVMNIAVSISRQRAISLWSMGSWGGSGFKIVSVQSK